MITHGGRGQYHQGGQYNQQHKQCKEQQQQQQYKTESDVNISLSSINNKSSR